MLQTLTDIIEQLSRSDLLTVLSLHFPEKPQALCCQLELLLSHNSTLQIVIALEGEREER